MLRRGCQPSFRIREISRKIQGLSPTQPRGPPAYSSRGVTPSDAQIHAT